MKNAHHIEDTAGAPGKGDPIVGSFPKKLNSVTAEVLAYLLCGEQLTGLESVIANSTTRLSARIHYLKAKYGWSFESESETVNCKDGRIEDVARYYLDDGAIAVAMTAGAASWCGQVFAARAALRATAGRPRTGSAK